MHGQQSGDQFQSHLDQIQTYSFSSHVNSIPITQISKPRKKNEQKLTLNIVKPLKTIKQNQTETTQGKFHKRSMYTNEGKIIKIGDAIFKSNFQSGSLGEVEQIRGQNTYLIRMDNEANSNRPTAWFYFRCQGLKGEVTFIISGFTKTSSLFNQGMKICCREIRKQDHHQNHHLNLNHKNKTDWHRGGTRISYAAHYDPQTDQNVFQLRFTYNFVKNYETHEFPAAEFAYCYPYEYKRINTLCKIMAKKGEVIFQSLGKTYEGREIPLLTIGNPNAQKSIVLSARVHPGETVSSFIMQGLLKELTSDSYFARSLKQKYLFKIVPMINPDGVVKGNYRFSGAGYDLNRRWKHCYESSHPQVYYLKNMIKKIHKEKKVLMYIDIHGHSRKKNVFFYGCCSPLREFLSPSEIQNSQEDVMSRAKQFPFLMSKLNPNIRYDYCSFNMSKDKEGTARIQMWKQLHIDHVYTLQSSFCGSQDSGHNYVEEDFMKIGKSLLEGISVYFYEKSIASPRQQTDGEVTARTTKVKVDKANPVFDKFIHILHQAKEELKHSPTLLNVGMTGSDSGSDSEPEVGMIPEQQRMMKSTTLRSDGPGKNGQKSSTKHQDSFSKSKSPSFMKTSKSIKISVRHQNQRKNRLTPQQLKDLVDQKLQGLKNEQQKKNQYQKQVISMTVNNFYSTNSQQVDSLTTESLMKKNDRVHSKQGNTKNMLQKLKNQRFNSENQISHNFQLDKEGQNDEEEKLKLQIMTRNLLKTRQGVQYRRVKKLAQQMKRKHQTSFTTPIYDDAPIPIVRGIVTVNNQLNLDKRRTKSIAPSFYPQSQNKNTRFSVEMAYRNNSFRSGNLPIELGNRRLFINGDDINVHCKGTRIYL